MIVIADPVFQLAQPLVFLLYVGPDQALPLLSFLGAILGFILMCWRRILHFARRGLKALTGKPEVSAKDSQ